MVKPTYSFSAKSLVPLQERVQMGYFSIFDTNSISRKELRRRHRLLLVNAVIVSWVVWCIVNARHYCQKNSEELLQEIIVDMIENLIEIIALVELSLVYSKLIIKIFWNHKRTVDKLFFQVVVLNILNALSALAIGVIYHLIYPEETDILTRVFITDFIVVSILSTTYFVSFMMSMHHKSETAILQGKLDRLALQTNSHLMFNSFSTLESMIRTSPDDAENFLQGLSNMYRYLISKGDKSLISLSDEIRFTDNYITLVNYRYEGIKVDIDNALREASDAVIPPVSIQQLVENAIKHNSHGRNSFLHIAVRKQDDSVIVENNIVPLKDNYLSSTKTGIENLRQRVTLLYGKVIEVQNDGDLFSVRIPLTYKKDLKDEDLDY